MNNYYYNNNNNNNSKASPMNEGGVIRNTQQFLRSLPPGYRFFPTDKELVVHYLAKKVCKQTLPIDIIPQVYLYDEEPEKITGRYNSHNGVWYFFTQRERKYANGRRPSRSVDGGYWKPTGNDKTILHNGHIVGYKKTLDYLIGKHPLGLKTNWKMHEYRIERKCSPPSPKAKNDKMNKMMMDEVVLCRLYKNLKAKKNDKSANAILISRGVPNEEAASQPITVMPVSYNALAISNANETGSGTSPDMTKVPIASSAFPVRIVRPYTSYNPFDAFTNCFGSNMPSSTAPLPPDVYHVASPSIVRQPMDHPDVYHVASPSSVRQPIDRRDVYHVASPSILRQPMDRPDLYHVASPSSLRPPMDHPDVYHVASPSISVRPPMDRPTTRSAPYFANYQQQLLINQDLDVQANSINDPPLVQPISSESFPIPDDDQRDDDCNYENVDLYGFLNFELLDERDDGATDPGNRQN